MPYYPTIHSRFNQLLGDELLGKLTLEQRSNDGDHAFLPSGRSANQTLE
jgi:hypothetical protein